MKFKNTNPAKLVSYIRDGLIEHEHFGYVVRCDKSNVIEKIGEENDTPFYLRSCEKPLQASLIVDFSLDKEFDMTDEEIAICCASHAGETIHVDIIRGLLAKFGVKEQKLQCGVHMPISDLGRKELLLSGQEPTVIHNNCSGKHSMMLGLCVLNGWDIDNYLDINHPLQKVIVKKVYDLCRVRDEFPITKDGCGVPVVSMPLKNMVYGYLNVFCDPVYKKIKHAFLNYPYVIGGENRTDTKIISSSKNIVAKVGAGGLCVVVNTDIEEGFAVKICDADMNAREIAAIDLINNLHWGKIEVSHEIRTLHDDLVGKIITSF